MNATSQYLNLPVRDQAELTLGKLLASIENGRTAVLDASAGGNAAVATATMKAFGEVWIAYDRYSAALASKPSVPETIAAEHATIMHNVESCK